MQGYKVWRQDAEGKYHNVRIFDNEIDAILTARQLQKRFPSHDVEVEDLSELDD